MTVLYTGWYPNYGLTREELQSGRPIIGIAQTRSDLSPCNRHHIKLAKSTGEGIRHFGEPGKGRVDMLIDLAEIPRRRPVSITMAALRISSHVGQLGEGMVIEHAVRFQRVDQTASIPRENY
jgi:hypothetical protein